MRESFQVVSVQQLIWLKWLAVMKPLWRRWNTLDIHVGVTLIGNTFSPHKWCSHFQGWLDILVPASDRSLVLLPVYFGGKCLQWQKCLSGPNQTQTSCHWWVYQGYNMYIHNHRKNLDRNLLTVFRGKFCLLCIDKPLVFSIKVGAGDRTDIFSCPLLWCLQEKISGIHWFNE